MWPPTRRPCNPDAGSPVSPEIPRSHLHSPQPMRVVADLRRDYMDDTHLTLQLPFHHHQPRPENRLALSLLDAWPHNEITHPGLILQRHENDTRRRLRPLAVRNDSGYPDRDAAVEFQQVSSTADSQAFELPSDERQRMTPQRQSCPSIVSNNILTFTRRREPHRPLAR